LNCEKKQCSIPTADPRFCIRSCNEGYGFFLGKKLDRTVLIAFRRDGKYALALKTKFGLTDCDEAEECVHCGQACVSCAHGVASALFKMPKESLYEGCIELFR